MKMIRFPKITDRLIFISVAVIIGIVMSVLSFDYGPLEDARIHLEHGERILDYFKGIDETASLSPLHEDGTLLDVGKNVDYEHRGMNGFGGFFDLLSSFLYQYFDFLGDKYVFKNFLNAIFGFLLFVFCGLLAKEIAGWKAGLLTLIFVVLVPLTFGYSMNNPKDIPAAAFYLFSIFHIVKLVKELPVITIKRVLFLIINMSLLVNIRLIGFLVFGYLLLAVFSWWFLENYQKGFKKVNVKQTGLLFTKVVTICFVAYLSISLLWPYAQMNPLTNPIKVFIAAKDFRGFENLQLFEGIWKSSFDMPWYYAIKNLFIIMMPLHVFLGFFFIPILYYKSSKQNILYVSLVLFTTLFPMFLIAVAKPNSHDGSRQFMFTVLPMVVISALSWYKLWIIVPRKNIKKLVFGIMILLMLQPLKFMVQYHPLQALYFSPLIGGVSGAYGNYEIDYYGVAVKTSLDWLEENVGDPNNPPRIRLYYGSQTKIKYYIDQTPNLQYALSRRASSKWDYSIIMLAEGKYKKDHLNVNWSPENTVHEVKIDGITLCYIVKNDYTPESYLLKLQNELAVAPSVNGYLELGLTYFEKQEYIQSIEAFKNSLRMNPNNSLAYNNICSAYNRLKMYDKAKIACEKAINLRPDFVLAKNNMAVANNGISNLQNEVMSVNDYLTLGYNYYRLGFFKDCIITCEKLLKIDPDNVTAYNNICSSYNNLEDYENAIKACEKAVKIAPDFKLAKNNLQRAKKALVNKK
ncbi:hypothetical protein GCM10009430_43980 [Aquimarina litoralis]|uniref:Tetratricopeptide repeat protein n=1 Tax=Aquimarina litoralis TaxID=584605 RepID=A0ABN1J8R9_9FLAO